MKVLSVVGVLLCLTACTAVADKITIDPNTGMVADATSRTDNTPAVVRVSVEEKRQTVAAILTELSEKSGVALRAGINQSDWQVRDRKMTIYCKDLPLSNLMNSIARVMRFTWRREQAEDGSVFYRLYQDKKARLEEERLRVEYKQAETDRRRAALNRFGELARLSALQVEALKSENRFDYVMAESGVAKPFSEFLAEVPGALEALAARESLDIPAGSISSEALKLLAEAAYKMPQDWLSSSRPGPFDEDKLLQEQEKMVIHINRDVGRTRSMEFRFLGDISVTGSSQWLWINIIDPDGKSGTMVGHLDTDYLPKPATPLPDPLKPAGGSDIPGLTQVVKVTVDPKEISDVQVALAKASGLSVVSDSYGKACSNVPNAPMQLGQLLAQIGKGFDCDWKKQGATIEFTDKKWFLKRLDDIPAAWLESWRKTIKETGTLGLAELSELAALTFEQYTANVQPDDVIQSCGQFRYDFTPLNPTARFAASLTSAQRAAILTQQGIDAGTLSPAQWEHLRRQWDTYEGPPPDPQGLTLRGWREDPKPGCSVYTFRLSSGDGKKIKDFWLPAPTYAGAKKPDQPPASK